MWSDNIKDWPRPYVDELLEQTQERTQWQRAVAETSICALQRPTGTRDERQMDSDASSCWKITEYPLVWSVYMLHVPPPMLLPGCRDRKTYGVVTTFITV